MNRRSLFAALAAVGIAPIAADHAVALAFEDGDYLAERKERLALHEADVNRRDELRRQEDAREEQRQAVVDKYMALVLASENDVSKCNISIPVKHYQVLRDRNLIDFVPNDNGLINEPTLCGHLLKVVRA